MRQADYRATLIVMSGLAVSTLTGYLREAALARQLGIGPVSAAYLIGFTIPEAFMVGLPVILSAAFIPTYAAVGQTAGESAAWQFGRRVAAALFAFLVASTLVAGLAAPRMIRWLSPGLAAPAQIDALHAMYVMLPAICLMGLANLVSAVLQANHRFALPAFASAVNNLIFVAALLCLPLAWQVGRAAVGVTLGAACALSMQMPAVLRSRRRLRKAMFRGAEQAVDQGIRQLAPVAGPLAAGYAVHHAILFVDRAMATTVNAGSVAALNFGYRLALVVGQLTGLAVSTAIFPALAEQAAEENRAEMQRTLASALHFVWAVGLPACCALILLRRPLVQILFERGAFDRAATSVVSKVVGWYAVAALADALCQPLWRVLYARRRAGCVLAVNSLQTAVRLGANLALIGLAGYNGLAMSAALGLSCQLATLGWLARRELGSYLTGMWWRQAARVVVGTAGAGVVTALVAGCVATAPLVIGTGARMLCGAAAYLTLLHLLKGWGL